MTSSLSPRWIQQFPCFPINLGHLGSPPPSTEARPPGPSSPGTRRPTRGPRPALGAPSPPSLLFDGRGGGHGSAISSSSPPKPKLWLPPVPRRHGPPGLWQGPAGLSLHRIGAVTFVSVWHPEAFPEMPLESRALPRAKLRPEKDPTSVLRALAKAGGGWGPRGRGMARVGLGGVPENASERRGVPGIVL